MLKDLPEAQHRIREDIDFCALKISSPISDRRLQEHFSHWILSRPWISSWLFTNCAVTSNICFNVRSSKFFTKLWIVEKFFPMNVAEFIVAAMNILQIFECSSPDSATFDILVCLFRTWSFTLFTNSAASLPMTKVSESAPSWELTFSGFPDPTWISSPYLAERAFLLRRFFTMKGNFFCIISQEVFSGFPDRLCSAVSLFQSWEDQHWS